ncbi:MAG: FKBP-type peptidyl-prolyl cis-trans isomerase [Fibrobacterales bacterium]
MKKTFILGAIIALCGIAFPKSPTQTFPDGLTVKTLTVGKGETVTSGSLIKVLYVGRLQATGAAFDSTMNTPFEFVLGAGTVIKGWDLGIIGMKQGEKRQLIINPKLGYGTRNLGVIPPSSTLDYTIELVSFKKPLPKDAFPELSSLGWKKQVPGVKVATLTEGTGTSISAGAKVSVHYTGWLKGGTRFDSSKDIMKPLEFEVGTGKAIKAWDLGLIGLREGGTYILHTEPQMAYGATAQAMIPSNSELVFKLEVLSVESVKLPFADVVWSKAPEGFEYAILEKGNGTKATVGKTVVVHYTGWLPNGTKFDSSVDRGQPFSFPLGSGRVIRGWDLGVAGMSPGEKRMLKIPGHLAYGERGAGALIPPNATLIFQVELIDVK